MISEKIKAVADEYIDKFIASDLSIVKINDDNYQRMALREALITRINKRGLRNLIAYTFMNYLYLEKL